MPVRYQGETQHALESGSEQVWSALQHVEAHPMTGKMMKSIEPLPPADGRPAWKVDMGHGEVITVTTMAYEEGKHMLREMPSGSVNALSR